MPKKSVSAHVVAKSATRKPIPLERVLLMAETELASLRQWVKVDPDTPYRAEAAARLRALVNELERSR